MQQHRNVAGLCVIYKTHKQQIPHMDALRQPWTRPHGHTTRTSATRDHQLIVPIVTTGTFQAFLPSTLHRNVVPLGTSDTARIKVGNLPSAVPVRVARLVET
ncbi:hypothetical protein GWK47_004320 [Chionoecetes opilio]|uniref:Uncharacterized protein n=1 Tax=Chionoecetes opilio TaxID=41210 RepID=A0A8J4YH94_CHIOP|nr:hypothetical protein GWK47_004320 [Chionoecetes opilio]